MQRSLRIAFTCLLVPLSLAAVLSAQPALRVAGERFPGGPGTVSGDSGSTFGVPTPDLPPLHRLALGGLTQPEVERLLAAADRTPLRIGIHRRLPSLPTTDSGQTALDWQQLADGTWCSSISLRSDGAAGLRVALDIDRLPAGVEISFRSADGPSMPLGEVDPDEELVWSPVIAGQETQVEILAPTAAAAAEVSLSVPELAHLVQTPWGGKDLIDLGRSGSCNRDIACHSRLLDIGASVAKYVFESDGLTSLCTGQLVADTDLETTRHLFLTAAHCVSRKKEARSMTFFWHFQRATCNGEDPTTVEQTSRGARLRFTTGFSDETIFDRADITIVELRRPPADGVTYSGWSLEEPSELVRRRVWGIHHPGGDVKKASKGKIRRLEGTHFQIRWRRGTTEGGSSGSGLWIGNRFPDQYLIGVLTAGLASCETPRAADFYGQLARAWSESPRLQSLLDPQ